MNTTTNFKGTKGKWKLDGNDILNQDGELISVACEGYGDNYRCTEDTFANALLISKAPEMLEMLEYFIENNMLSITGEEMAKQLIKEATEL